MTGAACLVLALTALIAPPCGGASGLWLGAGVLAVSLPLFYNLTVTVDQGSLTLRFGAGLIRRTVPLSDIVSVGAAKSGRLCGWGIHYAGGGWLYNVNSRELVELRLRSGGRLLIGTDDQAGLLAALAGLPRHDLPAAGK